MSWPSLLFLCVVAVACLTALAWLQSLHQPSGRRACSVCRARQQCVPGEEGQCCCRATDHDGCYHGLGLCKQGLTCVPDGTSTGTCRALQGPSDAVSDMANLSCVGESYASCAAEEFGDCCCPREAKPSVSACAPSLMCHRDGYRFISDTGVCVPPDLHLPPS